LRLIVAGCGLAGSCVTVSELAARQGVPLAGRNLPGNRHVCRVGQQLAVLCQAGRLSASRRDGRAVRHTLTDCGRMLLEGR
jgi:hypothetical protein